MGALDGLKILDFSTLLPGPYATLLLADLGAEVLKVSGRDKYDLVSTGPRRSRAPAPPRRRPGWAATKKPSF